jgi:acetoacetate decarboxylase
MPGGGDIGDPLQRDLDKVATEVGAGIVTVAKVVSATHIVAHLTLSLGKAVPDYIT